MNDKQKNLLVQYATYINSLEDILQQENWTDNYLNEIAEDMYLAYQCRKELDQYKYAIQAELVVLDQRLIIVANKLKRYKSAYKYFEKYYSELLGI